MMHFAQVARLGRSGAQRGVALPVMLIVLAIMLVSGAYLLKSSNSTTLTTANLAYQTTLNRANDLALLQGAEWLSATWKTNKALLDGDSTGNGYIATYNFGDNVRSANFWNGKKTIDDGKGNTIEFVIHRLCSASKSWSDPANQCMYTTPNSSTVGTTLAIGASMSSNAAQYATNPQLHYIITARINGPRGGNVISQLAVLMAA
jgi:hypothetical protein